MVEFTCQLDYGGLREILVRYELDDDELAEAHRKGDPIEDLKESIEVEILRWCNDNRVYCDKVEFEDVPEELDEL